MSSGVTWYVGCPGSGKTTRALADLAALERANRRPSLVIDSSGVAQLAGVAHVRGVSAAVRQVWGARKSAAVVPDSREDVERLARACIAPGQVNVLVDESSYWLDARRGGALLELMRRHRHSKVHLLLTTQHLTGDVSQAALACAPTLYVFRTTSRTALEALERDFGLSPAQIRTLERGRFLRVRPGF